MNLPQAHHVSKRPGDSRSLRGKNLSSPIVCRVTEIVNQPFPSKVHALTERVNPIWEYLRGSAEVLLSAASKTGNYPITTLP
jgi:hypothetical protein